MGGDVHITTKHIEDLNFVASRLGRLNEPSGRIQIPISGKQRNFQWSSLSDRLRIDIQRRLTQHRMLGRTYGNI